MVPPMLRDRTVSLRSLARRRQGKPWDAAFVMNPAASFLTGQSPRSGCCADHDLGGRMIKRVRAVLVTPDGCLLAIRRDRPDSATQPRGVP